MKPTDDPEKPADKKPASFLESLPQSGRHTMRGSGDILIRLVEESGDIYEVTLQEQPFRLEWNRARDQMGKGSADWFEIVVPDELPEPRCIHKAPREVIY